MKISRYSNSKIQKGLSTWPILKFVGKDILKFVGNCRRAPSMVDQRWKTVRDQRRVQRRMSDNIIQAHTYADRLTFLRQPVFSDPKAKLQTCLPEID